MLLISNMTIPFHRCPLTFLKISKCVASRLHVYHAVKAKILQKSDCERINVRGGKADED